jgi:hypothetical protein
LLAFWNLQNKWWKNRKSQASNYKQIQISKFMKEGEKMEIRLEEKKKREIDFEPIKLKHKVSIKRIEELRSEIVFSTISLLMIVNAGRADAACI